MQPTVLAVTMVCSQMERMNRRDDAVKRHSFSIAEMMAIVAIFAVDCAAIRLRADQSILVGGLPMQSALVIGLLLVFRWRRRGDKRLPFLVGFEIGGWIASVIFLAVCVFAPISLDQHLRHILAPFLRATGFEPFSLAYMACILITATSYLTAPQLAAALFAGWISQRWWKQTHPEPVSTGK
jgi:hypothetical protein